MTKEITKAFILQQIQDKFKLREFDAAEFLFSETVVPTYNIEPHLLKWEARHIGKNITGIGGQTFFTVPYTERWLVNGYSVVFTSGVYTVAGLYVVRENDAASFYYLDLTAAQSVSYAVNLPKVLELHSGDKISINIDGYTSTGQLRLYLDYAVEEVR